jgi:hypothetical protein
MLGKPRREERLAMVEAAFGSLPDRYLGAEPGFDATYHVVLGDVGHVWEVRCNAAAHVHRGATRRKPDVTIATDSATWLALREGEFSGVEAFERRLLSVRGNLDYAIAFEGLFRLPDGRPPIVSIHEVPVDRHRISTLTMGTGVAKPAVSGHLRRSLRQLKRIIEYEQLRERATTQRSP